MENKSKSIFIVGCNRSGTTLMQKILDAHSEIAIAPETHFFDRIYDKNISKITDVCDFLKNKYWKSLDLNLNELVETINIDQSSLDMFDQIIVKQAELRGKKIFGEKTPAHVFHVDKIKNHYPNSKIIEMIRDPRSVITSQIFKGSKNVFPYSLCTAIRLGHKWKKTSNLAINNQKKYPHNFIIIKFEELIMNPTKSIENICHFLEVDFESSMLKPPVINSSFGQSKIGGFNTESLERWKRYLSSNNQIIVKNICKKEMKFFGYI